MQLTQNALQPISKELLHTKIADAIIKYIEENHLKEGDKIPSERSLAERLSTSRNSVREALRVLENERIIEVKTGRGAYVTSNKPTDSIFFKLWAVDFKELVQVKYLLEKEIIIDACQRSTKEQIDSLEKSLVKMEEAAAAGIYLQDEDYNFHKKLEKLSQNTTLGQIVDILMTSLLNYGTSLLGAESYWLATIPSHRAMLEAIKNQNSEEALKAYEDIYKLDLEVLHLIEPPQSKE